MSDARIAASLEAIQEATEKWKRSNEDNEDFGHENIGGSVQKRLVRRTEGTRPTRWPRIGMYCKLGAVTGRPFQQALNAYFTR